MSNGSIKNQLDNCGHYKKFDAYKEKILALGNDSLEKTIAVALALCFVCAILVSIAAVALRPLQVENKAMDMKKNILDVAGLLEDGTDIHSAFAEQIEEKLVDIETGDYVDGIDVVTYDQRKAAKDPAKNIILERTDDIAGIKRKAKVAKVYLVKNGDTIESIILPMHGYGLWSTMYGFLALEADGQTVKSINFYDQAETPGLGGEVVNPSWRALWQGKKVYDDAGVPQLRLIKGVVDNEKAGSEYNVDGLAGATLTSNGVTNLVKYWMSEQGFAPYLVNVRTGGTVKTVKEMDAVKTVKMTEEIVEAEKANKIVKATKAETIKKEAKKTVKPIKAIKVVKAKAVKKTKVTKTKKTVNSVKPVKSTYGTVKKYIEKTKIDEGEG